VGVFPPLDSVQAPMGGRLTIRVQSHVEREASLYHYQLCFRTLPSIRKGRGCGRVRADPVDNVSLIAKSTHLEEEKPIQLILHSVLWEWTKQMSSCLDTVRRQPWRIAESGERLDDHSWSSADFGGVSGHRGHRGLSRHLRPKTKSTLALYHGFNLNSEKTRQCFVGVSHKDSKRYK
jgi:hypothetical protein